MQKHGTVIRWDAARAFGFIRSPGTAADVFFHLRDYQDSAAPREGLPVIYEEIHVGGKGPRAMAVRPKAAPARGPAPPASRLSDSPARRAPPHIAPARANAPIAAGRATKRSQPPRPGRLPPC